MTLVFADTVGLIALWDADDQWHAAASEAAQALKQRKARLVTTTTIFLECGNAAARRPYRVEIDPLRAEFAQRGDLLLPTKHEVERAWSAYNRAPPGGPSIVDCLSFEVMRRVGATEAFTNDRHFTAAGFTALF